MNKNQSNILNWKHPMGMPEGGWPKRPTIKTKPDPIKKVPTKITWKSELTPIKISID